MNSPTLPSAIVPNSSAETTFMTFRAKRCSLMAMAAPSISFEEATVKASSFTISEAGAPLSGALAEIVMSYGTVCPAGTTTCPVWSPRPV